MELQCDVTGGYPPSNCLLSICIADVHRQVALQSTQELKFPATDSPQVRMRVDVLKKVGTCILDIDTHPNARDTYKLVVPCSEFDSSVEDVGLQLTLKQSPQQSQSSMGGGDFPWPRKPTEPPAPSPSNISSNGRRPPGRVPASRAKLPALSNTPGGIFDPVLPVYGKDKEEGNLPAIPYDPWAIPKRPQLVGCRSPHFVNSEEPIALPPLHAKDEIVATDHADQLDATQDPGDINNPQLPGRDVELILAELKELRERSDEQASMLSAVQEQVARQSDESLRTESSVVESMQDLLSTACEESASSLGKVQAEINVHCEKTNGELATIQEQLSLMSRDQPLTFAVAQYNILANYLGLNSQPWLLYGANVDNSRREKIFQRFYEKDASGHYVNVGWPTYAQGILTDDEMTAVEAYQKTFFDWSVRRDRVLAEMRKLDADILSLVELDEYDDFREAVGDTFGSAFRKRPRNVSKDGCGIFWRKSKFDLEASAGFDFCDEEDASGRKRKDRTCLFVLLRFKAAPNQKLIAVSTHFARNPEDPSKTKIRVRQASQLLKYLTDITHEWKADGVPVVLMGDLNARHFGEIRGIVRAVCQAQAHPTHPFLWRSSDVPTGATASTETRKVRIDTVMFESCYLNILEIQTADLKTGETLPNAQHPSDHVPVRVKFQVKSGHRHYVECAGAWLECVVGQKRTHPMTDQQLHQAFKFFEREGQGVITRNCLEETCLEIGVNLRIDVQARLLECFEHEEITFQDFVRSYDVSANSERMRGRGDLESAFRFFDADKDGKILLSDLRQMLVEMSPLDWSQGRIDSIMTQFELSGEAIDVDTFCRALGKAHMEGNRRDSKDMSKQVLKLKLGHLREEIADLEGLTGSPSSPRGVNGCWKG